MTGTKQLINTNYLEERRITMSIPVRMRRFRCFQMALEPNRMPNTRYICRIAASRGILGSQYQLNNVRHFFNIQNKHIAFIHIAQASGIFHTEPQAQFN